MFSPLKVISAPFISFIFSIISSRLTAALAMGLVRRSLSSPVPPDPDTSFQPSISASPTSMGILPSSVPLKYLYQYPAPMAAPYTLLAVMSLFSDMFIFTFVELEGITLALLYAPMPMAAPYLLAASMVLPDILIFAVPSF